MVRRGIGEELPFDEVSVSPLSDGDLSQFSRRKICRRKARSEDFEEKLFDVFFRNAGEEDAQMKTAGSPREI